MCRYKKLEEYIVAAMELQNQGSKQAGIQRNIEINVELLRAERRGLEINASANLGAGLRGCRLEMADGRRSVERKRIKEMEVRFWVC